VISLIPAGVARGVVAVLTRHPGAGQRGEEAGRTVEVRHLHVGGAQVPLGRRDRCRRDVMVSDAHHVQSGLPGPLAELLERLTYGVTGRALLHALCGSDPARFLSMSGRFSRPVLPGESLTVSMWRHGDSDTVLFQTTREDGVVVIDRGRFQPAPASRP